MAPTGLYPLANPPLCQVPLASASLAQVYKGRLHNGDVVAVKVQRPHLRHMVSRDLVVMARASEIYERFARSFSADRTDYQAVLGAWGRGFYSELDFNAEAANQQHFIDEVVPRVEGLYVPKVTSETDEVVAAAELPLDPLPFPS